MSRIKDGSLAGQGRLSYEWARIHMPVLTGIIEGLKESRPLSGLTVGFCLQLTKETAVLLAGARQLGARVAASSGNPLTTQDDIAAFLASRGVAVYGWSGQTRREFAWCVRQVLGHRPDIVTDDGAELSLLAHLDPGFSKLEILGGTEETTTGLSRIRSLEKSGRLRYPVIAVNDARTKHLFDNRYGTGQSTVDGYLRAVSLLLAAKRVVVAGYGWVGKGVASRCRGMGARVVVTEVDPVRALEAHMDGFEVMTMGSAARTGDVFITCTGMTDVITPRHIESMKSGAVVANAGHFDVEVDSEYLLRSGSVRQVRAGLDECTLAGGKKIFLVSKGRVANLVAAGGHPPEVMDQSFASQLLSVLYIARHHEGLPSAVIPVPGSLDNRIAKGVLSSLGVRIDRPAPEQARYAGGRQKIKYCPDYRWI